MFKIISCFRSTFRNHFLSSYCAICVTRSSCCPIAQSFPSLSAFISNWTPQGKQEQADVNGDSARAPKLLVVQPRMRPQSIQQAKLHEALNLANSLEEQRDGFYDTEFSEKELPHHLVVQNPVARLPRADTYFGSGTVDTVKVHLNAVESKDVMDAVFVNAILTGVQQRNLERAWCKPVLDRVGLIIEIFNAHAQTKEAKLQAELAALMYKRSRLVRIRAPSGRYTFGGVGEAEVVSARGRGSGGRGFISGAGETELQLQRRRILERRSQLLSEIKEVRRTRAVQRAARRRHGSTNGQEMATIAVVGYTNAGKSTLVSALSGSHLYCDDRLFATVDPKLRSVILPSGRKVLLSDTVGFISDLPVQLVEAFHATLEEVVEADLLVHVVDSSAANLDEQRASVLHVLEEIGVSEEKLQNMLEVWNKIDLQGEETGCSDEGDTGLDSGAEDDDTAPERSREEEVHKCDNIGGEFTSENENKAASSDGEGDCEDDWISSSDRQEMWAMHDDSSVGWETPDDEEPKKKLKNWRSNERQHYAGADFNPHAKTSAITGVGLQELLELIDERLKSQNVVEQHVFDRKWRPPRAEDTGFAVEN